MGAIPVFESKFETDFKPGFLKFEILFNTGFRNPVFEEKIRI